MPGRGSRKVGGISCSRQVIAKDGQDMRPDDAVLIGVAPRRNWKGVQW